MRELISRITVSASGRLTEPLKWTLLGGIAIPSVPESPRTADRRELSDPERSYHERARLLAPVAAGIVAR